MSTSTARILALLELLQAGGVRSVPALAERLGVDERTVRRYVGGLRELGVPVEAVRGRYGGYRIAPGHRLPPLMLGEDEALAVLLGLLPEEQADPGSAAASAAGKLRRVLPRRLAERLEVLLETAEFTARPRPRKAAPDTGVLLGLAQAVRERRPVEIGYRDRSGRASERTVLPYGLVAHAGRWYLAAGVPGGETRTFRVDRIAEAAVRPGSFTVPRGFDPAGAVLDALARTPWQHDVSVRVRAEVPYLREHLPPGIAALAPLPDDAGWTRLRIRAERLDWLPGLLASLDRPFAVERPDALREAVRSLAHRLTAAADADADT